MRMRSIDAESLKELFPDNGEGSWTYNVTVKAYIDAQPTVQPEHKTGHWVKSDMQRWYDVWLCSECGEKTDSAVMSKPRYKYCPMCGAKMERGERE